MSKREIEGAVGTHPKPTARKNIVYNNKLHLSFQKVKQKGIFLMVKRKRTVGLIAFLKGSSNPDDKMPGCANYDNYYGGCLFSDKCNVLEGKRCGYFEKAVLPTAVDIGLSELVYKLYARQVGIDDPYLLREAEENVRRCPDCRAELRARQRYCDICSKKRRRESYRKIRSGKRLMRSS